MRIIITGATGMAGAEVVRQAIRDPDIAQITILVRRPLHFTHPKVKQVIHDNFMDYTGLDQIFQDNDVCIWCLGISQSRVNKQQYTTITYDYTLSAAKAMLQANPSIGFGFLSGEGADSTETSNVRFAKVKGQTENALLGIPIKQVWIFRPGGIIPVQRNPGEGLYKRLEITAVRIMNFLAPATVVDTATLARAMLRIVKQKGPQKLYRHKELKSLGK